MIQIIYVGYQISHPEDFSYHRDDAQENWLIIHTLTSAEFLISGKWKEYPENQILIFPPYTKADYRACHGPYRNNWIAFKTNEKFILNSTLPTASPILVACPEIFHYLFHMLSIENHFDYIHKEQSINHLFHLLFDKLSDFYNSDSSALQKKNLLTLHLEIQSNPGFPWTVPYMAKRLNISTGYLQVLYRKTFGVSCMEDVFQKRIELAKEYLTHSHYTIAQIADICGYQSLEHFCRQFRRVASSSPSEYRAKRKEG